jgi:hypothetical protein
MQVRLKEDDSRFGLRAGDVLDVRPYSLDPRDKLMVIRRVSDDPECSVYRSSVELVR